jgi:hypothetical protein
VKAVWGATPEARGQLFEVGDRIGTACGISLTRMEEERRDGDERNRSAGVDWAQKPREGDILPSYACKAKVHVWR